MLILFETSLGVTLFKIKDGKLEDPDLHKEFASPDSASSVLKLKAIHKFNSTTEALEDITQLQDGKLSKSMKKFLQDNVADDKKSQNLAVMDPKLASTIAQKLNINVVSDSTTVDLFRGVRQQLPHLLNGIEQHDMDTMSLGLSHSLSRFKLRFSPDKVDVMVIQAIALLDDLDKELNIYAMRVKEWYGWHFPEMAKIISDNIAYAKIIKLAGFRTNIPSTDLSSLLPEDLEQAIKVAANISMGTEISDTDIEHILSLSEQVISIAAYRQELYDYLRNRMNAIAPNLTALVGELVGARLISHAGSLTTLAKYPASTVQILGAEKALFRALKTKHDTPKYGLIYHASLVGSAPQKLKGKMARMVATKTSLSSRLDALADAETKADMDSASIGIEQRASLESRLRALERSIGIQRTRNESDVGSKKQNKFDYDASNGNGTATYNSNTDNLLPTQPAQPSNGAQGADGLSDKERRKAEKKAAKAARKSEVGDAGEDSAAPSKKRSRDDDEDVDADSPKKESKEEKKARKEAKRAKKAAKE
ncbi:hypothetical protein E3P92_02270 [Wallemia ichthyophaga]|uniref:Nucleolar protein 58 n=2 Tax=Wallemia ichthyophaga TaxID=245174 RepID=A0A4T0LD60_WALIC|nr:Nucleolar protein 58 [Wallemia ichthyophaga EXF-994]TIA72399.1 hypothetical protein E3P91_02021 [Wallemia ichthyophaga]EOR01936.1 Nucleolar protein 58 [Wallemia ichthyophaga EXF-994]TIA81822.1 hypothetical protein E3P98_01825 [Wallemia ichthyophaga]TIB00299.1 hypothetical protein E3P95_01761 [Wallemia ichthyophaga]TIB01376.1 hypothetical protein E3P94_01823 [Wallemia ichthyophaga]